MKLTEIILISLAILVVLASPVVAKSQMTLKNLAIGGLGFLSSYYIAHEGSHLLYAILTEVEGFRFTSITGNWWADETPSIALRLTGLTGQALYSEGILAFSHKEKRGPFLHAALLTNIVWEIAYPLLRGPDFDTLSDSTVNLARAGFGLHALLTAYRAYRPQKPDKKSLWNRLYFRQNNDFTGIFFQVNF